MKPIVFIPPDQRLTKWASFFLVSTLFVLPLSSTAKSVSVFLALIAILSVPAYRQSIGNLKRQPWCRAACLLFVLACFACFWSPANWNDKLYVIEKYSKLLYLPILAVGFQDPRARQLGLHAFLMAMLLTSCLAILKFHGYLNGFAFDPDYIFRNHIMTGFMLAFATYIAMVKSQRQQVWSRLGYGVLGLVFSYQLFFINAGRTGYVIYCLLMLLLVTQSKSWQKALGLLLIVMSVLIGSYYTSPVMHNGVNSIVSQLDHYQHDDKNTPIGLRLQFHRFAHQLFNQHPWIGNGTASFTYYFALKQPVPIWSRRLWEPHSQYWFMAVEFGVIGIMALAYFFISLARMISQLHETKAFALAVFGLIIVGSFSDSHLFYSGSGYFFIFLMALCLGEQINMEDPL